MKSRICSGLLLVALITSLGIKSSASADTMTAGEMYFLEGHALYESGDYGKAISLLNKAIENEPRNPLYHHVLAKSYGRMAEKTSWFKAIDYARKTRSHLEMAVELDSENIQYLDDLMDYYREAPGFLGGDKDKAAELQTRIKQLQRTNTPELYTLLSVQGMPDQDVFQRSQ